MQYQSSKNTLKSSLNASEQDAGQLGRARELLTRLSFTDTPRGLAAFSEHCCYSVLPEIRNKEIRLKTEQLRAAALVWQISWQESCDFGHQMAAPCWSAGSRWILHPFWKTLNNNCQEGFIISDYWKKGKFPVLWFCSSAIWHLCVRAWEAIKQLAINAPAMTRLWSNFSLCIVDCLSPQSTPKSWLYTGLAAELRWMLVHQGILWWVNFEVAALAQAAAVPHTP